MTFDTFARLLRQRLTKLGYKTMLGETCDLFYIENYCGSINLFKIEYCYKFFQYAESPNCTYWTQVKDFTFKDLKKLFELAKQYTIYAKEKLIKDKLNEINKDFQ